MTRHNATPEGNVPFTTEEEARWDTMATEWAAGVDDRNAEEIRSQRDTILSESDWVVVKANETSTNVPDAWKTYRQELRDISSQAGFPNTITWPTKPS